MTSHQIHQQQSQVVPTSSIQFNDPNLMASHQILQQQSQVVPASSIQFSNPNHPNHSQDDMLEEDGIIQKREIDLKDKMYSLLESIGESKYFDNPFEGLHENERSILLMKRIKDIKNAFEKSTSTSDCIDSFRQCGIFVEYMNNEYKIICRPTKVRELKDRLDVLEILKEFQVREDGSEKNLNCKKEIINKNKKIKKPKSEKSKKLNKKPKKLAKCKIQHKLISSIGSSNWNERETIKDNLGIQTSGYLNDKIIMEECSNLLIEISPNNVKLVDSLNSESRFRVDTFKKLFFNQNTTSFIPFFIRKETVENSHWIILMIKYFKQIELFIIDSLNNCYNEPSVSRFIDKFVEICEKEKIELEVFDVKIVNQITNFECGYRVINTFEMLINNNCDINCLQQFDYNQFMNVFVKNIVDKYSI